MKFLKYYILFCNKFFAKIDNDLIVMSSFHGKYSDSPMYLTKYIHELAPYKKIVWLVNNIDNPEIPEYVIKVKYNSNEALKYRCKAKILIDNVYGEKESWLNSNNFLSKIVFKVKTFLHYKKGQFVYTTWHGTPLKRMGADQVGSSIVDFSCPNTSMILGNTYTCNIMQKCTFNKIPISVLGSPRNDILCNSNISADVIKDKLGIDRKKKVILFAPTFRSNNNDDDILKSGINQINMINIEKLKATLNKKFNGDWVLVCRFHYHVEKLIDWDEINEKSNGNIINGNKYDDMSYYLKCADVLITDISSCLFDYIILKKPIFLFFPDYEYYKDKERGFYLDIEKLPFQLSLDFNQLLVSIKNFDEEKYLEDLNDFSKLVGSIDDINSSKKIAKFILENDVYDKKN